MECERLGRPLLLKNTQEAKINARKILLDSKKRKIEVLLSFLNEVAK